MHRYNVGVTELSRDGEGGGGGGGGGGQFPNAMVPTLYSEIERLQNVTKQRFKYSTDRCKYTFVTAHAHSTTHMRPTRELYQPK